MRRRKLSFLRRQSMTETIILIGIVGLGVAWVARVFPAALTKYFVTQQAIVASPL